MVDECDCNVQVQEELMGKVQAYEALSKEVQKVVPDVLIACMRIYKQQVRVFVSANVC